jgi:hypothetical protein
MTTNPTPIFGRPEFAKTIHAEFPKLFEVLPRALAALNDLTGRPPLPAGIWWWPMVRQKSRNNPQ